jgi:hypothetical protein
MAAEQSAGQRLGLGHVGPLHLIHVGASRLSKAAPGDANREPWAARIIRAGPCRIVKILAELSSALGSALKKILKCSARTACADRSVGSTNSLTVTTDSAPEQSADGNSRVTATCHRIPLCPQVAPNRCRRAIGGEVRCGGPGPSNSYLEGPGSCLRRSARESIPDSARAVATGVATAPETRLANPRRRSF